MPYPAEISITETCPNTNSITQQRFLSLKPAHTINSISQQVILSCDHSRINVFSWILPIKLNNMYCNNYMCFSVYSSVIIEWMNEITHFSTCIVTFVSFICCTFWLLSSSITIGTKWTGKYKDLHRCDSITHLTIAVGFFFLSIHFQSSFCHCDSSLTTEQTFTKF